MAKPRKPKPLPPKPWIKRVKSPQGDPTVVITAAGLDAVRLLATMGMSQRVIAGRLGVAHSTFTKHLADTDEALRLAWEAGYAEHEWSLVQNLQRDADGGFSAASMFLLKTMHGFNEDPPPRQLTNNILIQLPAPMSEEEYARTLALPAPSPEVEVLETIVPPIKRSLVR